MIIIAILMILLGIMLGAILSGAIIFTIVNLCALAFGVAGITFFQAVAIGLVISLVCNIMKSIFK